MGFGEPSGVSRRVGKSRWQLHPAAYAARLAEVHSRCPCNLANSFASIAMKPITVRAKDTVQSSPGPTQYILKWKCYDLV